MVRVHITGAVTVFTGTSPYGQGLETSLSQVAHSILGVPHARINRFELMEPSLEEIFINTIGKANA